jgi:L-lactate dehydrogenase complex protein LldG
VEAPAHEAAFVNARDTMLASIRRSLGVSGREETRRATVAARLKDHPRGIVPTRGQRTGKERLALFRQMVEAAAGTVEEVASATEVPQAVARFLRSQNLPMEARRGEDARLGAIPWASERTLEMKTGPSAGKDLVGVSHGFAGVAETGTLILVSGADNPTTLNFLPDTHVVVVDARDIAGDFETVFDELRTRYGEGSLPRTVNCITGPSRSADIEQTLILGAHGPRQLRVIVVGSAE